jgi:hypothetical protein
VTRQTVPLAETASGILDGSGNGAVFLGPGFGQIWNPSSVSVIAAGGIPTTGTPANPATCTIMVGSNQSGAVFVDATYQVTGAASSLISGQVINVGQYIFVVFANCIPGSAVAVTVNGTFSFAG